MRVLFAALLLLLCACDSGAIRAAPTPVATPSPAELVSRLDDAWAKRGWTSVLNVLDQLEETSPSTVDIREKRYAAMVFLARDYQASGKPNSAAVEFAAADQIDPRRSEAREALMQLTPTAVVPLQGSQPSLRQPDPNIRVVDCGGPTKLSTCDASTWFSSMELDVIEYGERVNAGKVPRGDYGRLANGGIGKTGLSRVW